MTSKYKTDVGKQAQQENVASVPPQDNNLTNRLEKFNNEIDEFHKSFDSMPNTSSLTQQDNGEYFLRNEKIKFDKATNFFYIAFFINLFFAIIFWFKMFRLGINF